MHPHSGTPAKHHTGNRPRQFTHTDLYEGNWAADRKARRRRRLEDSRRKATAEGAEGWTH